MRFSFGVEHEVAFLRGDAQFADFTDTSYADFDRLIARLPLYPADYPHLHVGDAGIRLKRWYIEGVERFSATGELVACVPKGIEIRTTPHGEIAGAIRELTESFAALQAVASECGLTPVCTSFNPFCTEYVYDPPLTRYEHQLHRETPELQTDALAMLTYGPDLNLSLHGAPMDQLIDIGRKLTFYSPCIVPWSFSSPFYAGGLWDGLSVRTYIRNGRRPAVRVFVEREDQLVSSAPILTKLARNAGEVGRIEFKAFDTSGDFSRYAALLALLKGLVLDSALPGRAIVPDTWLYQVAAREGFNSSQVYEGASQVIAAAASALEGDADAALLDTLRVALEHRTSPADALRRAYEESGSILDVLRASCLCVPGGQKA